MNEYILSHHTVLFTYIEFTKRLSVKNVEPDPTENCGPYAPASDSRKSVTSDRRKYEISEYNHDTIGTTMSTKEPIARQTIYL